MTTDPTPGAAIDGKTATQPVDARWLLELIDLLGGAATAATILDVLAERGHWPAPVGAIDDAGAAAIRHHLAGAGLVSDTGPSERPGDRSPVDVAGCRAAAVALRLVAEAVTAANQRRQPEPSRLVVTATAGAGLMDLAERLVIRRLWDLVEHTVRSADDQVTLGAPYWNRAALERLRPCLEGARSRDVSVDFVVQGGEREPSVALGILDAFAHELRGPIGFDTVRLWQFDADELAARHILCHAKFVMADAALGYLGSANMTDQGFDVNFEIGVTLGPQECEQLHSVLDALRDARVLRRL